MADAIMLARGPSPTRRAAWLFRLLAAFALSVAGALALPLSAHAATGGQIDSFNAAYTVETSGTVHVTETIVYRFGSEAGHGIKRVFVTREKWNDNQDAVYTYTIDKVSSPSGAPAQYTKSTSDSGRTRTMTLKIGDPNRTVSSPTATYRIDYTVQGALRDSDNTEQLYWDVTGNGWDEPMQRVTTTVTVPQGVPGGNQGATCFAGPVKSSNACTSSSVQGATATFTQDGLSAGDGLTVAVKLTPGTVSNVAPHLVKASKNYTVPIVAGATGVTTVGSIIVGILYWRKHGRDKRYIGLPPGMVPTGPGQAAVGFSDPSIQIPVQFTPPRIPVAEAGLLVDGQVDHRETAATLVDLAVRRAIRLEEQSRGNTELRVRLLDPSKAVAPHEMVLMTKLFNSRPPGAVVVLGSRGTLTTAHDAMVEAVRSQVTARQWFAKVPKSSHVLGGATGCIGLGVMAGFLVNVMLVAFLPLLPIVVTALILRAKLRRGQRTPDGRAVCDQVEGFRQYLATAEADQLRFEEGEDIFSRYLPWAIVFDLAERWSRICADLVAMGRIPDVEPYWYGGNFRISTFNAGLLASTLTTSATPMPSSTSSGTGFGGGSGFSGGFSGGGGGGGGGGGW